MDSPDNSGCSSSNEQQTTKQSAKKRKREKKKYMQKFSSVWELEPAFKGWLQRSAKGNCYFRCKICNEDYTTIGGRSNLKKHQISEKHVVRTKAVTVKQPMIASSFAKTTLLSQQVKEAEIRLSAFIAEHNIAFTAMDHLVPLIQAIATNPELIKNLSCGRTKCSQIVKNVTGASGFEKILQSLRSNKFSIIVDESTDVSSIKHLVISARYFDEDRISDNFLGLIPVADAKAQSLYNSIVNFFAKYAIPYKENLIGFASDGASNMFGVNHSLAVLLAKDVPNIFTIKCICHSFALCASYACATLPRIIEDVCRDVYNYLNNSYKRLDEFKQFQTLLNIKPHKMLQPSQTRWLSLLPVVKRLLEQYDALNAFFEKAAMTDKILAAETIAMRLREAYVKMYLQFLEFVLPFFHTLNIEMQAENSKIHVLYERVSAVFKSFVECFMKPEYLKKTKLDEINVNNPDFYLPLDKIYLGAKLTAVLFQNKHNVKPDVIFHLRQRCLTFYIEGCKQIQKRFNFKDPHVKIIKMMSVLDSSNFTKVGMTSETSIAPLASSFPNLISADLLNDLDAEWRELRNMDLTAEGESSSTCEFWVRVKNIKCGDGTPKFLVLATFVLNLLALPHSSANAERIFSQVNINKTKTRNRLDTETLEGLLHTKSLINDNTCFKFPIGREVLKRHNDAMYDREHTGRSQRDD